jgi:hypothetical protein
MGWRNKSDLAAPSARFYKGFAAGVQDAAEGRRARQLVPGLCTQPGEIGTHQGEYTIAYFLAFGLQHYGLKEKAADPKAAWLTFTAGLSPAKRAEMLQAEFDHRLGGLCHCLSHGAPTADDIADAAAQALQAWGDTAAEVPFQVTP